MAAAPSRKHRNAVTRLLRATGMLRVAEEAPLVELVKVLAAEMDAGGGARTRADYLSALKDLRRVVAARRAADERAKAAEAAKKVTAGSDQTASTVTDGAVADLESFKRAKGGAAAG